MNRQICPIPTGKKETIGKGVERWAQVQAAFRPQQFAGKKPKAGAPFPRKTNKFSGSRLARFKLNESRKVYGNLKSLWETKEKKSGNEIGRTNQPPAPSILSFRKE
jgi:hypothetical protein